MSHHNFHGERYRVERTRGLGRAMPAFKGSLAKPSSAFAAMVSAAEEELRLAARVDVRVLISAEDRELRETCARFIHRGSLRSQRPFVTLPNTMVHVVPAAWSGPPRVKVPRQELSPRLFERARGGTLFIDDIAELYASEQKALLSWLEEHAQSDASSTARRRSPVRIIAGASGRLDHQRRAGNFSECLFYRLNIVHIDLSRYAFPGDHRTHAPLVVKTATPRA